MMHDSHRRRLDEQPPKKGAALQPAEACRGASPGQPFPLSQRGDPIEALRERVKRRAQLHRRIDIACKILLVVMLVLSTALVVSQ